MNQQKCRKVYYLFMLFCVFHMNVFFYRACKKNSYVNILSSASGLHFLRADIKQEKGFIKV